MGNLTKKQRVVRMKREGLHEIKNKRRPRVKQKKSGAVLATKKKHVTALVGVMLSVAAVGAALGCILPPLFSGAKSSPQVVSSDFVTAYYIAPVNETPMDYTMAYVKDESAPVPAEEIQALRNVGYLNYQFWNQNNWYLEMHGTTETPVGPQSVNTFKQYSNGTMIMADVTSSPLVKAARQFCYIENKVPQGYGIKEIDNGEVMWRLGTSYTGQSYDAMQSIRWKTGKPFAHMSTPEFMAVNGLPGTEFTVYIINEQTLLSASEVVSNGDGTYSQSYVLDPALDKAPAHYANQMKFTGGLTALPSFNYIHVTFTFDENWRILATDINEQYKATMGISVTCTSTFHSEYEYNTERCRSSAYDEYFKQYVGKGIDNTAPVQMDAMNCLSGAFLTKPVSFGLDLDVNGKQWDGGISLDATKLDIGSLMKDGALDIESLLGGLNLTAKIGDVDVTLEDKTAYLSVGGVKAKLSIGELLELINGNKVNTAVAFSAEGSEGEEEEVSIFIIDDPATDELNDGFTFEAGKWAKIKAQLDLNSLGIELVIPLEFEFELDKDNNASLTSATLNVDFKGVKANVALGAPKQELPALTEAEKAEYIDLLPYAEGVANIFSSGAITATVDFEKSGLKLDGTVAITLSPLAVAGDVAVSYGGVEKRLNIVYSEGVVYVTVDELCLKVGVNDVSALIQSLMGESDNAELSEIVDKVLALNIREIISLSESVQDGKSLKAVIDGTAIVSLFASFDLGEVTLTLTEKEIGVNVLGATLSVAAGGTVTLPENTQNYVDIAPVLRAVPDILNTKQIALNGAVTVASESLNATIVINNGVLSFADGFALYLDAAVVLPDSRLDVALLLNGTDIQISCGDFTVSLSEEDIALLKDDVNALYQRLVSTADTILAGSAEMLPSTVTEIIGLLKGMLGTEGEENEEQQEGLSFLVKNSEKANGLLCVEAFGLTLDLIDKTNAGGLVCVALGFTNESMQVGGALNVALYEGELPELPATESDLGVNEFKELLDYVGAIFGSLSEFYQKIAINGTIKSSDTKYAAFGGVKSTITGAVELFTGGSNAIQLNLEEKTFVISTDAYVHVQFALVPSAADEKGIYLDLYLLDYDFTNGQKDDILDCYISVSYRTNGKQANPLNIYAPANEILPLLSSVVAFLGVDQEIVSDYLFAPWFSMQTAAELKGFGNAIKGMIAGLLGGESEAASITEGENAGMNLNNLISSIAVNESTFRVAIPAAVFGATGEDFVVEIGKEPGENGSRLTAIAVSNIYAGSQCISLGLSMDYNREEGALPAPSMNKVFELKGVANLLHLLSHSATHEADASEIISGEAEEHEYLLNKNFFIDGVINLNLNAVGLIKVDIAITVEAISVSFDEDGTVGVNVRFSYAHKKVWAVKNITVINGDTTIDLTGKNGMVYMKRVQTTDDEGNAFPVPETTYRVMPLGNFFADLVNQAGFAFNLGKDITDLLAKIDMGGSDNTTSTEEKDVGDLFWMIFKGFTFTPGTVQNGVQTTGDSYSMIINGAGLNDMLSDIVVNLKADKEGKLRSIDAGLTLTAVSVITIKVDLDLEYHNPCGVMDSGVTDNSVDIELVARTAMDKALKEAEATAWEGKIYIEGKTTTVTYSLMGETVKVQEILFNTQTGECYAQLIAPEVTLPGYTVSWNIPETVSANLVIYGALEAKQYTLTLVDADGVQDNIVWNYTYGDSISEYISEINNNNFCIDGYNITEQAILEGTTQFAVTWKHIDFVVVYTANGSEYARQYYGENSTLTLVSAPVQVGYVGVWKYNGVKVENGTAVTGDMQLVLDWEVDPVVTLRLYSDVRFSYNGTASTADTQGYYVEVTYTPATGYALPTLSVEGFQQMGWWFNNGSSWSLVTSAEGKNGAQFWAMWLEDIKVKITDFYTNSKIGGKQYNIGGTTTGGRVYGRTGNEIYTSLNMKEKAEATFYIQGSKSSSSKDNCGGKASVTITYNSDGIGSFLRTEMNSWDYRDIWPAGAASYGGVEITKTFSYNGKSISTTASAMVSLATYTVTFTDEEGNTLATVTDVRLDCPHDNVDSATYLDEIGPANIPEKDGYTASWAHVAVTGNMTVKPVYTPIA